MREYRHFQFIVTYFIEKINDMSYPEPFVPETDLPAEKKILDIVNHCNAVFKDRLIKWNKTDEGSNFWSFMQDVWRRYLYKNKLSY